MSQIFFKLNFIFTLSDCLIEIESLFFKRDLRLRNKHKNKISKQKQQQGVHENHQIAKLFILF